jgi:hypothetical protein
MKTGSSDNLIGWKSLKTTYIPLWKERGTVAMDSGSNGIYLPMQLTDWLLVEVALLLVGLSKISFVKNWFRPSGKKSSFKLSAQ